MDLNGLITWWENELTTEERRELMGAYVWDGTIEERHTKLRGFRKKWVVEKWKYAYENGDHLWKTQAGIIYKLLQEKPLSEAKYILKEDYEKYKEMGISTYIADAIQDIESIEGGVAMR